MLQTFGDGIQVSVLKNNWQGANITIQVGRFRRKWRQTQEVAGTFDSIGHLLVTVGTDAKGTKDRRPREMVTVVHTKATVFHASKHWHKLYHSITMIRKQDKCHCNLL